MTPAPSAVTTATAAEPPAPHDPAPDEVKGSLIEIPIPLGGCWGNTGLFCIVGPFEHALSYVRWRRADPTISHNSRKPKGRTYQGDGKHDPIIWLPRRPETASEHGTLAHEALHAVHEIAEFLGAQLSDASQEFYAYAIGHVVRCVMEEAGAEGSEGG